MSYFLVFSLFYQLLYIFTFLILRFLSYLLNTTTLILSLIFYSYIILFSTSKLFTILYTIYINTNNYFLYKSIKTQIIFRYSNFIKYYNLNISYIKYFFIYKVIKNTYYLFIIITRVNLLSTKNTLIDFKQYKLKKAKSKFIVRLLVISIRKVYILLYKIQS